MASTNPAEVQQTLVELFDSIYLDTSPDVDENICKIISNNIKINETNLVSVVEELGPRLTSTHVLERSKAVEILALVFTHLPSDFLKENELTFIVDFLCDRCKDQHMVIPKIIMCVLPIVKNKNLPPGAGIKLLESLFREANVQSHVHKIRHTFFTILQVLLSSDENINDLQNMSSDFVMNFLQSMDGEKDPRNLLLLFRIIPIVISKFKLEPFTEDFFEILSCYFPVDFNPTHSIPGQEAITRQDLSKALHACLSQTNEFAEFLVPLVLEKLESSLVDAKQDSLELLQLCCKRSYQPRDLEPFLAQIWHVMRKEIFMGGNDDVEKKCYEFLQAAFAMISVDGAILNKCLTMIYSECKHHLSEPELRLIVPTSNLLRCITESSEAACSSIVQNMFPVVYEQVCSKSSISEKKRLLGIWETLIYTSRQYKEINFKELVPQWDEIKGLWFTLLTTDDWEVVKIALKIFSVIVIIDKDFKQEQRNMLQEHLLQLIGISCNSANIPQEARTSVESVASSLSQFYGEEFANVSIPRLLATVHHSTSGDTTLLCNNKCSECENFECQSQTLSLRVLGKCSHLNVSVFNAVAEFLLGKLESNPLNLVCLKCLGNIVQEACNEKCRSSSRNNMHDIPDLYSLFSRISISDKVIALAFEICKSLKNEEEISRMKDSMISISSNQGGLMTATPVSDDSNWSSNNILWESVRQATGIIRDILKVLDEKEQDRLVSSYWNNKVDNVEQMEKELSTIPGLLVESILGSVQRSVKISLKKELMNYIFVKVLLSETLFDPVVLEKSNAYHEEFQTQPYIRLLASFVNKAEDESLDGYLSIVELNIQKAFADESQDTSCDTMSIEESLGSESSTAVPIPEKNVKQGVEENVSSKTNLINALIWVVKALAMRGFSQLEPWVEKIIALLKYAEIGDDVVKFSPCLMADDPYCLNKQSFCKFMFLYRQRLFLMLVDKLVEGYRSSSAHQNIQFNFIRALGAQLKHVPSEILFMKIDSVLPLLVASLKCNSSSQVLLSTLNALTEMMQSSETKDKFTDYCNDLVPQLLILAKFKDSMNVRIMSLKCLRKCAKAPSVTTLPLKEQVVESLVRCLDDPKRLVRKEAVLTRSIWTLIGAPGGLE